jgi:hypothetical protein
VPPPAQPSPHSTNQVARFDRSGPAPASDTGWLRSPPSRLPRHRPTGAQPKWGEAGAGIARFGIRGRVCAPRGPAASFPLRRSRGLGLLSRMFRDGYVLASTPGRARAAFGQAQRGRWRARMRIPGGLLSEDGDQGRDPNEQRRRGEARRETPPAPLAAELGERGPTTSRWVARHRPGRKASFRKLSKPLGWCIALQILRRQERSSPERISPEQINPEQIGSSGASRRSRGTSRAIGARPASLSALEATPTDAPAESTTMNAKSPQHPTSTMK